MEPVADSQTLPAPAVPATLSHAKQTVKDPKKQEAGRKGATARQQKMEALKVQLAAAKEAVYSTGGAAGTADTAETVKNKEHTTEESWITHASPRHPANPHDQGPGWLVGVGLLAIVGVVLFVLRSKQTNSSRVLVSSSRPGDGKVAAAAPTGATQKRSIFDIE